MKKIAAFLLLASLSLSATAVTQSSEKELKKIIMDYEGRSGTVTYLNVKSVWPKIMTNKQCQDAFLPRKFDPNFPDTHTTTLDIMDRKPTYKWIDSHHVLMITESQIVLKPSEKNSLKSPKVVSVIIDTDTMNDDGHFYSAYCYGEVHGVRNNQAK